MAATRPSRPVLRYHGGKWLMAERIISYFPKHRIYIEAFGGAASVLMCKPKTYAEIYNELDGEIVNLFRVLRDVRQARELERVLRLTPFARDEFELSYVQDPDPIEQARRTVIRCFMGFGSTGHNSKYRTGFRANSNRSGTTPAHDWANYPDALQAMTRRLSGVTIEARPAIEVIEAHDDPTALHYVDPPYVHDSRSKWAGRAYRFELTDEQHRDLAKVLHDASGMVVLSGYPSQLYDELYSDWLRVDSVSWSGTPSGRDSRIECLWLSPRTAERSDQMRMSFD